MAYIGSEITGSGSFVKNTSPTFVTPILGTPQSGVLTNCTGTAAGLTAGSVTTNANLTGVITSSGNATSIASQTGTGTKFVVDNTPTLITPVLGVATATSIALGGGTAFANYVVGTFTPTVTGPATVPVYTTNTGRYTRIGNRVFVDIYLNGDGGNEGSGSGKILIALPVTAGASNPVEAHPIGSAANSTTRYLITGEIAGGGSTIGLSYYSTISAISDFTGDTQNNTIRWIRLQFFYEV